MKKVLLIVLVALVLSTLSVATITFAQDEDNPIAIEYGQTVDGEIDNDAFENYYVFSGNEDDVVLIEMFGDPGSFDIDPRLELRDDDGDLITENDDFDSLNSLILIELDNDDDFTIVATRYGGEDGSGEGHYTLRLSLLEPSELGGSVETQIAPAGTEDEDALAHDFFIFTPEDDTVVRFTYQAEYDDELFGSLNLSALTNEPFSPYAALVSFNPSIPLSEMSFAIELEGGDTYVLWVARAFASYPFEGDSIPVTVTTEIVE